MEKVLKFLKDCGTFYLATVDSEGAPHVRPFGAVCAFDGKIYFITANTKAVFAQLKANPKAEISGMAGGSWIRLSGDVVVDTRREAKAAMLEQNPGLKDRYNPDDGVMEVFYLQNAEAVFCSSTSAPEVVKL